MSIPEEDIVYEVSSDDQLMTESSNSSEDVDDSTEIAAISASISMALQGLETVQAFLLQENASKTHKSDKYSREIY